MGLFPLFADYIWEKVFMTMQVCSDCVRGLVDLTAERAIFVAAKKHFHCIGRKIGALWI